VTNVEKKKQHHHITTAKQRHIEKISCRIICVGLNQTASKITLFLHSCIAFEQPLIVYISICTLNAFPKTCPFESLY